MGECTVNEEESNYSDEGMDARSLDSSGSNTSDSKSCCFLKSSNIIVTAELDHAVTEAKNEIRVHNETANKLDNFDNDEYGRELEGGFFHYEHDTPEDSGVVCSFSPCNVSY